MANTMRPKTAEDWEKQAATAIYNMNRGVVNFNDPLNLGLQQPQRATVNQHNMSGGGGGQPQGPINPDLAAGVGVDATLNPDGSPTLNPAGVNVAETPPPPPLQPDPIEQAKQQAEMEAARKLAVRQQLEEAAAPVPSPLVKGNNVASPLIERSDPRFKDTLDIIRRRMEEEAPEYNAPYDESDKLNPRKMMWAGFLLDLGRHFSSNGRVPLQGTGLQYMMDAEKYNKGIDKANREGRAKHEERYYKRRSDAITAFNDLMTTEGASVRGFNTANMQQAQLQQGNRRDSLAEAQHEWDRYIQYGNLLAERAAASGQQLSIDDRVKISNQEQEFRKAHEKYADYYVKGLDKATQVVEFMSNMSGPSWHAAVVSLVKALDPEGSPQAAEVASYGPQVVGLLGQMNEAIAKHIRGEGSSTELRAQFLAITNDLKKIYQAGFNKFYDQRHRDLAKDQYSHLDHEVVLGHQPNFDQYDTAATKLAKLVSQGKEFGEENSKSLEQLAAEIERVQQNFSATPGHSDSAQGRRPDDEVLHR